MSEGRNELTDSGESDGLVSGTFPAADSLLVEIFEGCCCVANCDEEQKQAQQDAGTMDGMPCCPQTNSPGTAKGPAGEEAEPPDPEYAGMCEQIKLQLSLIGGPYYKFAVAFEPILDIPPGPPNIPGLDIGLFGVDPNLKLPSIPVNLPGIPSIDLGLDLPDLPGIDFFTIDVPPFPGMPLLNMSIKPISLGLDLFKLKLPDIPDFDPCEIAKFKGQLPPDHDCGAGIPPINVNIAICWLCMLLFFLFIIMPILIILLGMKEKGLLETDENGEVNLGTSENPLVQAPPKIKVLAHHPEDADFNSAANLDNNPIIFVPPQDSNNPTIIHFQICAHELKEAFDDPSQNVDLFSNHEVREQSSPRVQPENIISGSEAFKFEWSVHEPAGDIKDKSENFRPSDYETFFNDFKNTLTNPPSLEQRRVSHVIRGDGNTETPFMHRVFSFGFKKLGLHEVYCTVTLGSKSVIMASYVQIGRPEKITELPPILKSMPRFPISGSADPTIKDSNVPEVQQKEVRESGVVEQDISDSSPPSPPVTKGV